MGLPSDNCGSPSKRGFPEIELKPMRVIFIVAGSSTVKDTQLNHD